VYAEVNAMMQFQRAGRADRTLCSGSCRYLRTPVWTNCFYHFYNKVLHRLFRSSSHLFYRVDHQPDHSGLDHTCWLMTDDLAFVSVHSVMKTVKIVLVILELDEMIQLVMICFENRLHQICRPQSANTYTVFTRQCEIRCSHVDVGVHLRDYCVELGDEVCESLL